MLNTTLPKYHLGDQISIKLPKYGEFTATAEKTEENRVLFIFDQIVTLRHMNSIDTNVGGFKETALYHWLQDELLPLFPEDLKKYINELTIPTIGQIVGHTDKWDNEHMESDEDEQLPLMRDVRHRIAALDNKIIYYWLQNASKSSWTAAIFALVIGNGVTYCSNASNSFGVRPAFWLGMKTEAAYHYLKAKLLISKEEMRSKTETTEKITENGRKAGEAIKAFMDGFASAGFTEDQAFQYAIVSILSSVQGR